LSNIPHQRCERKYTTPNRKVKANLHGIPAITFNHTEGKK